MNVVAYIHKNIESIFRTYSFWGGNCGEKSRPNYAYVIRKASPIHDTDTDDDLDVSSFWRGRVPVHQEKQFRVQ